MSDALNKAVDGLINPTRVRLYRDAGPGEWQTLPSLWAQLSSSGQWAGGNAGGGAFGSRPVISTGVVSLIIEITDAITEAATDFGRIITSTRKQHTCYCKPYRPCPGYILTTERDHTAELRAIAASVPDTDQEIWWTEHLRTWASQIKATLGLNPSRPQWAHKTPCPDCGSTNAYTQRDGETVRTPALAITWAYPDGSPDDYHEDHDYKIRAVECRACGVAWFRGTDLDALVEAMLNPQPVAKPA